MNVVRLTVNNTYLKYPNVTVSWFVFSRMSPIGQPFRKVKDLSEMYSYKYNGTHPTMCEVFTYFFFKKKMKKERYITIFKHDFTFWISISIKPEFPLIQSEVKSWTRWDGKSKVRSHCTPWCSWDTGALLEFRKGSLGKQSWRYNNGVNTRSKRFRFIDYYYCIFGGHWPLVMGRQERVADEWYRDIGNITHSHRVWVGTGRSIIRYPTQTAHFLSSLNTRFTQAHP